MLAEKQTVRTRDPWQGLRQNSLLSSLPPQDALLLAPYLRRVLHSAGDRIDTRATDLVYFPETLVVCLVGQDRDSAVGMVGREGLVGWNRIFDANDRTQQVFVAINRGSSLGMPAARLRSLILAQPQLAISLIPFLQRFAEQMSRTLQMTLHCSLEVRLSAWLLMMHERVTGDELAITHRLLAALLNVRRASVTDAMHVLEGDRALRCSRGRVVVLDPEALHEKARSTAARECVA